MAKGNKECSYSFRFVSSKTWFIGS